jgi:hypothetical protein
MKDKHKIHWTDFYQGEQIKYVGKVSVKDAFISDEIGQMEMPEGKFEVHGAGTDFVEVNSKSYRFWLSIRKAHDCLFPRRFAFEGKIIWGYSIRLRLFGKDII